MKDAESRELRSEWELKHAGENRSNVRRREKLGEKDRG